jgi:hypothetical protein
MHIDLKIYNQVNNHPAYYQNFGIKAAFDYYSWCKLETCSTAPTNNPKTTQNSDSSAKVHDSVRKHKHLLLFLVYIDSSVYCINQLHQSYNLHRQRRHLIQICKDNHTKH